MTASTLPFFTIGRCLNRRLVTNSIASPTVVVGGILKGSFVITSETFVLPGSRPAASTLFNASRSVKMPTNLSPSITIKAPICLADIVRTHSVTKVSGPTEWTVSCSVNNVSKGVLRLSCNLTKYTRTTTTTTNKMNCLLYTSDAADE